MPKKPSHESIESRLIRGDEQAWIKVFDEIVPRARVIIQNKFGPDKRWLSADDAVASACRTTFRRLKVGLCRDGLNSWEDVRRLLVTVASNKIIDSLRKAGREVKWTDKTGAEAERAEARNAKVSPVLEGIIAAECDRAMRETLAKLDAALEDTIERIVFEGKLEGLTELEIAARVMARTGGRMTRYMVRENWKAIRARFNRKFPELRGVSFPRRRAGQSPRKRLLLTKAPTDSGRVRSS